MQHCFSSGLQKFTPAGILASDERVEILEVSKGKIKLQFSTILSLKIS